MYTKHNLHETDLKSCKVYISDYKIEQLDSFTLHGAMLKDHLARHDHE